MNRFLGGSPATVVLERPLGGRILFAGDVYHDTTPGAEALIVSSMGEERVWLTASLEALSTGEWVGTLASDGDSEPPTSFLVRATLPRDAEALVPLEPFPSIPMPVDLIGYILNNPGATMPELYALADDDGFVVTLMLSAPTGLYLRYASMWHELTTASEGVVDGLSVYEVAPAAVELFDERDRQGQLAPVTAMVSAEGGDINALVEISGPVDSTPSGAATADEPAVTAAGVRSIPLFRTADDAPDAIAAAVGNPDLRWWVERRLQVLGIEADLPWS